jgi:protein-L-isoaspartate(D-aspartate) O-methyltransferase
VSERRRRGLVADLRARGLIRSERVAAAFLGMARERFVAEALAEGGLDTVYSDEAIVTKRDARGCPCHRPRSRRLWPRCWSWLTRSRGDRVLEVGAGTRLQRGAAGIVGSRGRVTSIEIDFELALKARRAIREAGYRRLDRGG